MSTFKKILIANRGAIATRIIRTLNTMGIESVAVYAQSDYQSLHVQNATEAHCLGDGGPTETYLNIDRLLQIAKENNVDAIHPGYGFLSENTTFVKRCESAGICFIGPDSTHISLFGEKHVARELATAASVPLLPGTELLSSLDEAIDQADQVGYPIMLKSTAGGGGIGMRLCADATELSDAFASVQRLGESHFANNGVFLEKAIVSARHIEVQVFGDGEGKVISIGERDCSAQRRNQKVIEESPAPHLTDELRHQLHTTAERLLESVSYRNAGTVEFIVDAQTQAFYFLEVNTRLQVEHGVTELVYGIDLVNWMVQLAAGTLPALATLKDQLSPSGHAIQARVYAEDPWQNFRPCPGPLSRVSFPELPDIRIEHALETGIEIPAEFDPMLAKVMAHAASREQALSQLDEALQSIELYGSETNLVYLSALCSASTLVKGEMTTRFLDTFEYQPARIDVVRPGTMTTIQDVPGRAGYWSVGIPPSGPFDSLSFSQANQLLGNEPGCAGLEITLHGPCLRFSVATQLVVTGAEAQILIDDAPASMWSVLEIQAGQTLSIGSLEKQGARAYLCVAGGIQCPDYLGSRATFTLGRFGGHNGAALKTGDVLHLTQALSLDASRVGETLPQQDRPPMGHHWNIRVIHGPHSAPDFFTPDDIEMLFATQWRVHYNSSRTGVRLIGPTPQWARSDGGEAGLHPSNIHDNAYAFGSIDFTGDMPVILGPDGPSLGGFVCPATVISSELWKLGQLRAGDTLTFEAVPLNDALLCDQSLSAPQQAATTHSLSSPHSDSGDTVAPDKPYYAKHFQSHYLDAVIHTHQGNSTRAVYRAAGDNFLLIEYGDAILNMASRFRVHALMQWLDTQKIEGILELTPGIRSLQIHYDGRQLLRHLLIDKLLLAEDALDNAIDQLSVPSRIVHLPLSWDDPACQEAIDKYDQSVRKDAPWYPSNLEFIRRINGLDSIEDVKRIVFEASYLVMGLGDVYLGAPVATPINPAHRLVTTKYNPARTWTAENSVGIGGSYLCVYGMEGPGGYQFVGRTMQMWNRNKVTDAFTQPWLLRFFDQIRFYEVSHDELMQIRRDFPLGNYALRTEDTELSLAGLQAIEDQHAEQITQFTHQREQAFSDELTQWRATGQFNIDSREPESREIEKDWPDDCVVIESPVSGSLWQCNVAEGDTVNTEQSLLILESMKMEIVVASPDELRVRNILFKPGQRIMSGQPVIVLEKIKT